MLPHVVAEACSEVCLSCEMFKHLLWQKLADLALEVHPSTSWVRSILKELCMSYRKLGHDKSAFHPLRAQEDNLDNLLLKVTWFRKQFDSAPTHVVNLDETACMVLPLRQTGWGPRAAKFDATIGNSKAITTVTVAMAMEQGPLLFLAQILHAGKTDAVLPRRPWEEGVMHSTSPNGWTTTDCILQFLRFIDSKFNPGGRPTQPCFLVWDLCTVHTSLETRQHVKDVFPWICLCYIAGSATASFKSFKASMRNAAIGDIAKHIGVGGNAGQSITDLGTTRAFKRSALGAWTKQLLLSLNKACCAPQCCPTLTLRLKR
eukprot:1067566-Amphidinium_carterae.1